MIETSQANPNVVSLRHVNPVSNYVAYSLAEKCFVCGSQAEIRVPEGHPAFDVFLINEEADKAAALFEQAQSHAMFHPMEHQYYTAGGSISGCPEHKDNTELLRDILHRERKITAEFIETAMYFPDLPERLR